MVYAARPLEASRTGEQGQAATHRIESRPVQIVGLAPGLVYVRGLLEEGEVILDEGLHKFTPGQLVQLLAEGEDA